MPKWYWGVNKLLGVEFWQGELLLPENALASHYGYQNG